MCLGCTPNTGCTHLAGCAVERVTIMPVRRGAGMHMCNMGRRRQRHHALALSWPQCRVQSAAMGSHGARAGLMPHIHTRKAA